MINFTRIYYGVLAVIFSFTMNSSNAQCGIVSTDGYNVALEVRPISAITPSTCPYGYNYNIMFLYNVHFNGTNIPSSLYTLQGNLYCDGQANFFNLPNGGGSGSSTTVSNPWRSTTDCATATTSSLKCTQVKITIQGPGIPYQTIDCVAGGILPVNLVSFNGRLVNNNNVYLAWVTATETNNQIFTVERSIDAVNWNSIATINGALNSTTNKEYSYTDGNLLTGMYYYRLKQTDVSGTGTYSNIIAANITRANSNTDVTLAYQNNQLSFTGLGNSTEWEIGIFNSASAAVLINSTIYASTIQLPNLASGVYFVKLKNKLNHTEKIVKFFKG